MSAEKPSIVCRSAERCKAASRDGDNAAMSTAETRIPIAVLDTNVVLDWLVFRNPDCAPLASALAAGELRWVATHAMRDELAHVLGRGHLDEWSPDMASIWTHWERHCAELAAPPPAVPAGRLRCSDPDDQKFIDLAVGCNARWLLSHDRAVLRLARRLRDHGVETLPPGRWAPPTSA